MTTKPARSRCSTKPLRHDLRHDLVGVVDALAPVKPQRECERGGEVLRIGGSEIFGRVAHERTEVPAPLAMPASILSRSPASRAKFHLSLT